MSRVKVVAETNEWVTRDADPDDKWDHGDTAGSVSNVYAELTDEAEGEWSYHGELVKELGNLKPGDTVYAVVVDYESGDTFGRSGGYAQVMDVFDDMATAEGLYRECVAYHERDKRAAKVVQGVQFLGRDYYVSWDGYFESVNDIEVWQLVIRGGVVDGVRLRTGR